MTLPDLPVPVGATAHDWCRNPTGRDGELIGYLSWSTHDAAVGGASTAPNSRTGFVERYIKLYDAEATELTAAGARKLATTLLSAADVYDGVP